MKARLDRTAVKSFPVFGTQPAAEVTTDITSMTSVELIDPTPRFSGFVERPTKKPGLHALAIGLHKGDKP